MNRLNQITTDRFSARPQSPIALRRTSNKARTEVKREDDVFRQIIRTPVPMGFFTMLSNAKKLSPLG